MKPTLPEDRELEEMSSDVSERYRAAAEDEPSTRLDAAVFAAARREVQQPRQRQNWQMPASMAAMLVIGVSLVLLVRDNEPNLPSLDAPSADEAKLAKSVPPQLAMKTQPSKPRADLYREDRPSRERSARPEREPAARDEVAAVQEIGAQEQTSSVASALPAPAVAPANAGQAKPAEQEQFRTAESSEVSPGKKVSVATEAVPESRASVQSLRKEDSAALPVQPQDWLRKIDDLLRDGREADAREQLLGFRRQFPNYPLAQRLQALLPTDQR